MRFAIISDVHGNLTALEAVALDLESSGMEQVYVAGDLALFGPNPRQCVSMIRKNEWASVRGNTDRMIADFPDLVADGAIDPATSLGKIVAWTREELGDDLVEFLGALPPSIMVASNTGAGSCAIFHGTPRSDEEGLIEGDNDERLRLLTESVRAYAIVGGHTHKSFYRMVHGTLIANAGSVGRSYEGRPGQASYVVLDDERGVWMIEVRHVRYDHRRNYRALGERGIPIDHSLAEPFNTAMPPG